jgi:hypothetical protein
MFLGRLAFELADIDDILEFGFREAIIFAGLTSEAAEDVARFIFAADFDEPAGGLGHEIYHAEKKDERGDLECYGESPYE